MAAFSGCSQKEVFETSTNHSSTSDQNNNESLTSNPLTSEAETTAANSERKITMLIDNQQISVTLYNTPAANSLYEMLPLELTFEDYNATEKISYLKNPLDTEGESYGFKPSIGDLCLYAPWGNLSIFYRDFGYSDDLISLGHIDSDIDMISNLNDDFTVILDKAD